MGACLPSPYKYAPVLPLLAASLIIERSVAGPMVSLPDSLRDQTLSIDSLQIGIKDLSSYSLCSATGHVAH